MDNLYSLDTYTATVNFYIEQFIEYAKINYEALTARGERFNNMVSNLFKGYLEAREKCFVMYKQHQKDKYAYV